MDCPLGYELYFLYASSWILYCWVLGIVVSLQKYWPLTWHTIKLVGIRLTVLRMAFLAFLRYCQSSSSSNQLDHHSEHSLKTLFYAWCRPVPVWVLCIVWSLLQGDLYSVSVHLKHEDQDSVNDLRGLHSLQISWDFSFSAFSFSRILSTNVASLVSQNSFPQLSETTGFCLCLVSWNMYPGSSPEQAITSLVSPGHSHRSVLPVVQYLKKIVCFIYFPIFIIVYDGTVGFLVVQL